MLGSDAQMARRRICARLALIGLRRQCARSWRAQYEARDDATAQLAP